MYSSLGAGLHQIRYCWSDDEGDNWSDWENISQLPGDCRHVSATVDLFGNVYVVWRFYDAGNNRSLIYCNILTSTGWLEAQAVAESDGYQLFPSITITPQGKVLIVWTEADEFDQALSKEKPLNGVIKAVWLINGQFSDPIEIGEGMYPGLPLKTFDEAAPLIFSRQVGTQKKFEIILTWLEPPVEVPTAVEPKDETGYYFPLDDNNHHQEPESSLGQNYPNPFNPETWIPYQLAEPAEVLINMYSGSGQLIRTMYLGQKPKGVHQSKTKAAYWDGKNEAGIKVASGIYYYHITAGDFSAIRKMVVVR